MSRSGKRKSEPAAHGRNQRTPRGSVLYGIHAVEAALANPRRVIHGLKVSGNAQKRLQNLADSRGVELTSAKGSDLDRLAGPEARHQGAVLFTEPLPGLGLQDLADMQLIVALDQVSDPQNVGAVLRSAAVFGADALVMTQRHSPPLSGALAKAASGGLEHVGIARVPNLARALRTLAEFGFQRVGLDGSGDQALETLQWLMPLVLVLGAEGKGLRRLTAEHCDQLARIATPGPIESLNISNAAAIALHTVRASRPTSKD